MTDNIVDTSAIQEKSLVDFAAQLGYEPVYSTFLREPYDYRLSEYVERLVRFKQPRFACVGEEYLSVKTVIKLHNGAAEGAFDYIRTIKGESLSEFLSRPDGEGRSLLELVAAGGCKIVKKVKGQYSRKNGFRVQGHMVKFMTPQDYAHYGSDM